MKECPLVSVLIPNYNHAIYLERRINSILSQTYSNLEIIILDDCSTDNSLDIINRYKGDSRISAIVQNEENSGSPFAQWKKGISIAKGAIVWIAESDDACKTTLLEELVDLLQKNRLVMAFCLSQIIRGDDSMGDVVQKDVERNIVMTGNEYISKHISMITNASSAIFLRKCALNIENNYFEYKGTGDWLFWAGIAYQGNVGVLAKPLNYYRVHENSTTSKMFSNGRDFFELNSVYKCLYERGLWGSWAYIRNCAQMLYAVKYVHAYDNESIRKSLLVTWNKTSVISRYLCLIMRCRFLLKQIIKR